MLDSVLHNSDSANSGDKVFYTRFTISCAAVWIFTSCSITQAASPVSFPNDSVNEVVQRAGRIRNIEVEYDTTSTRLTRITEQPQKIVMKVTGKADVLTSSGWMLLSIQEDSIASADFFRYEKGNAVITHLKPSHGTWIPKDIQQEDVPEADPLEPLISFFLKTSMPTVPIDDPTTREILVDGTSEYSLSQTFRDKDSTAVVALNEPGILDYFGRDIRSDISEDILEFTRVPELGLIPRRKKTVSSFQFSNGLDRIEEHLQLNYIKVNQPGFSLLEDTNSTATILRRFPPPNLSRTTIQD
jgi:hypothetical protein